MMTDNESILQNVEVSVRISFVFVVDVTCVCALKAHSVIYPYYIQIHARYQMHSITVKVVPNILHIWYG
jgi:hypothetical protein